MSDVIKYGMIGERSPPAHISAPSRQAAEDVMQRAKRLVQTIDRSIWDLGQAISEILDKQLYLYGFPAYSSFDNFADVELGFGSRKAAFYAQIFRTFFAAELGPGEINHLGSTKCRLLARVITIDNKDFWIKKAEELTTRQLENAIMKKKASLPYVDGKLGSINIPYYDPDTFETWSDAKELASRMTGCDSMAAALEVMCQEFLSSYASGGSHDQDAISQAECSVYEVMNRDNWRCVVCGKRTTLEAHHTLSRARHPELKNDIDLQVTICNSCHRKITDEEADLIQIDGDWVLRPK